MKGYNRPYPNLILRSYLDIVGDFATQVEETVGIVVPIIEPLNYTPHLLDGIPCGLNNQATVAAGEFGVVGVRPGQSYALQVERVHLINTTAGAMIVQLRLLTATQLGTVVVTATGLVSMASRSLQTVPSTFPSQTFQGSHTALLNSGILDHYVVAANSDAFWTPPAPGLFLYGDDSGGVPGLGVWNITADEAIRASFNCRQWMLPKLSL